MFCGIPSQFHSHTTVVNQWSKYFKKHSTIMHNHLRPELTLLHILFNKNGFVFLYLGFELCMYSVNHMVRVVLQTNTRKIVYHKYLSALLSLGLIELIYCVCRYSLQEWSNQGITDRVQKVKARPASSRHLCCNDSICSQFNLKKYNNVHCTGCT